MAGMNSFYGGRQGNSFTIAKRFDGINISEEKYTKNYYAVDENGYFIITEDSSIEGTVGIGVSDLDGKITQSEDKFFIKRTELNSNGEGIESFKRWKIHTNDGVFFTNDLEECAFYPVAAQGMLQFFKEGIKNINEVGFGDYVLIDTVSNLFDGSNPDNGKIYRRSINIIPSNGLYGAEFVGQIGAGGRFQENVRGQDVEIGLDENGSVIPDVDVLTPTTIKPLTEILQQSTGDSESKLVTYLSQNTKKIKISDSAWTTVATVDFSADCTTDIMIFGIIRGTLVVEQSQISETVDIDGSEKTLKRYANNETEIQARYLWDSNDLLFYPSNTYNENGLQTINYFYLIKDIDSGASSHILDLQMKTSGGIFTVENFDARLFVLGQGLSSSGVSFDGRLNFEENINAKDYKINMATNGINIELGVLNDNLSLKQENPSKCEFSDVLKPLTLTFPTEGITINLGTLTESVTTEQQEEET